MKLTDLNPNTERQAAFLNAWNGHRGDALIPGDTSGFIEKFPELASWGALLELVSPTQITIRFVGAHVIERDGTDATGRNYLEFVDRYRRKKAAEGVIAMLNQPAVMVMEMLVSTEKHKLTVNEVYGLPFANSAGEATFGLFLNEIVTRTGSDTTPGDQARQMDVTERRFFDIGNGIPEWSE